MNKRAAHTGCAGLRLCLTAALIAAAGACRRQDVPPPLDEAYSARVILSTNRVTVGDLAAASK